MVKHIVLFNLTEGDPRPKSERIEELRMKAHELCDGIPGVLLFQLMEGYSDYDVCIYVELVDKAANEAYDTHPRHVEFKQFTKGRLCDRACFDAEL